MILTFHPLLAQTAAPGAITAATQSAAATQSDTALPEARPTREHAPTYDLGNGYYFSESWILLPRKNTYNNIMGGAITLVAILIAGYVLIRIFRRVLERHALKRSVRAAGIAVAVYMALLAYKPHRMVDPRDMASVIIHRLFVAVMLIVGVRLVDRLIVVPLLTRGGKVAISRFVHQIIIIAFSIFVIAGYCSWAFGLDISSFLAGSAVLSLVLGLALQETLGNFFSGMVLQAALPFQAGDWIQVGETEGRVVEMTWRAITIHTDDDNYVLIPNGSVAKERIINYHTPSTSTARNIDIGIDYDVPPNDARRVLLAATAETQGVLATPAPVVYLNEYASSAIVYRIQFWIDSPAQHWAVENAVRVNAWYRLKQAGYNIPFQITTIEMVDLEKKRAGQRQLGAARRFNAIHDNALFASLSDDQKHRLAEQSEDISLAPGQTFCRQGDAGDSLFLLISGSVSILAAGADGRERHVGEVHAGGDGSFFGELSAMTGHPRAATVRAQTDVTAIEITRADLQDIFASDPTLLDHFARIIAQREKEQSEHLRRSGAQENENQSQTTSQTSVLDRMKRLFASRHR